MTTPQRPHKRKRPQLSSPGENSTICPVFLDPILDATENTEGQEAIFCQSTCNSWIHRQCAGLSQVLFKIFEESDEPFYCPHCRLASQDKQLQELKSMVDVLSKEVVSLKSMASDQQAPKSPSSTPQQRPLQESQTISAAAGKQTQPPTITKTSPSSRGDRKFNVVVYGINECDKGTPRHERLNHDLHKVTTIVTEAKTNINPLSMRDLLRLGKYRDNSKKPRPILVRFNRAVDSSLLLSKASALPKDIRVKPDMSKEERLVESLLLKVRRQQIDKGIERKHIKMHNNNIYIRNKLHGQVIDSVFVPSRSQQDRDEIDATHNKVTADHDSPTQMDSSSN